MGTKVIFVLAALGCSWIQTSTAQSSSSSFGCAQQFDAYRQCARSQISKDTNDPSASDNRRQQMKSDFTTCATQNGCQDPYPPESERSAREACFAEARSSLRQQLQSCVQSQYRDVQLPGDDNDKDSYWNFILMRTFTAMRSLGDNRYNRNRGNKQNWQKADGNRPPNDICGSDDNKKNKTLECLKSRGTFSRTSAQSNWRKNTCRIKQQCDQVSPSCQDQWTNQTKPKICDCVSTLKSNGLSRIQDQYVQCLRNRGVRNVDNNDDGRLVIAKNLNNWCAGGRRPQGNRNQTDPCKRRRGNGNGNGNGNWHGNGNNGNGNGGNWNGNGRGNGNGNWNGGNNGGSNGNWNGGSNGNNGNWNGGSSSGSNSGSSSNWNGGSSSSSSSGSDSSPYDDGTPAQAPDANPFAGMMNGNTDMFSQVSQSTSTSSGGSSLTSGLSSLGGGGGGGLGGLLGGGSPLGGGGFSSLLGGGSSPLGGLGGGGGLGGLSSLGGGGLGNLGGGGLFSSFLGGGSNPLDMLTGGGLGGLDTTSLASSPGALTDSMPSMFGGVGDIGNLFPS